MDTRPTPRDIAYGISDWDVDANSNFAKLFSAPFPIFSVDDVANLPAAADYDECLALAPYSGEQRLYISDGVSWSLYDSMAANVPQSTATTVADLASDFNDFLTSLKTATPIPIMVPDA